MRFVIVTCVVFLCFALALAKSGSGIAVATIAPFSPNSDSPTDTESNAYLFCLPLGSPSENFGLDLQVECPNGPCGQMTLAWPWAVTPLPVYSHVITIPLRQNSHNLLGANSLHDSRL